MAKELDLEQEVFDTPFEAIETGQAMSTGKCDIAAAGMTITDERAEVMDFTDPYFNATQALLMKKGSGISSLEDLAGKTLAVQVGTTGAEVRRENAPKGTEIRDFEDLALLSRRSRPARSTPASTTTVLLRLRRGRTPTSRSSTEFETGEQYGFAVEKDGNDELLEDRQRGAGDGEGGRTYDEIYEKYFGEAPPE